MKKVLSIIASALLLSGFAFAQAPSGEFNPGGENLSLDEIVSSRTQEMVEQLGLDENQASLLAGLNSRYAGKISSLGFGMDEMPNFAEMTEEDRQKMMNEMSGHMDEMQSRMEEMEQNEASYDEALKAILDKKQLKTYNKEKKREQLRQQQEMQAMFSRDFDGGDFGGGGFGGGSFGGGFGGGFAMGF